MRFATVLLSVGLLAGISDMAFADATVTVSLWDKGKAADHDMSYMAAGADMTMATMGVKADVASVAAGKITFQVSNDSGAVVHEMVVAPLPADGKPLPVGADGKSVDEDAAASLGEVSELNPGATGSVTLELKPGKYILYCNVPKHFMNGMWTILTVTS